MVLTTVLYTRKWAGHLFRIGESIIGACIFFKGLTGKLPDYLSSLLERNARTYSTRSNDWLSLRVPRAYSDLGKTAFSVDAPKAWNDLQGILKLEVMPSFLTFKGMLSTLCMSDCDCFK